MRIYFVRHGETEYNQRGLYYGRLDVPLSDMGRHQAQTVGRQLQNVRFDAVYASDRKRAVLTAQMILSENAAAKTGSLTVCQKPDLGEIDFGLWEGKSFREIVRGWPDEYQAWADDWQYAPPPQGEAYADFDTRIKDGFDYILKHSSGEDTILIVGHNGPFRVFFAHMLGLPVEGCWHFNFEQDAYSMVDFEYNHFTVRKINTHDRV